MAIERKAFHRLTYGLYLVAAQSKTERSACIINTALQVTSDPFQLLICVNKDNFTEHVIADAGAFEVMALSQSTDMDLIRNFGFKSMRDFDKFAQYPPKIGENGSPYLEDGVCAAFGCRVVNTMDAGTHMVFLAEVEVCKVFDETAEPLTYPYYRAVLKGSTPPKASSFIGEDTPGASGASDKDVAASQAPKQGAINKFQCLMCGYVVETELDELPDGFTCPMCGAPKERFTKIS